LAANPFVAPNTNKEGILALNDPIGKDTVFVFGSGSVEMACSQANSSGGEETNEGGTRDDHSPSPSLTTKNSSIQAGSNTPASKPRVLADDLAKVLQEPPSPLGKNSSSDALLITIIDAAEAALTGEHWQRVKKGSKLGGKTQAVSCSKRN
jgi:hypothetical protein